MLLPMVQVQIVQLQGCACYFHCRDLCDAAWSMHVESFFATVLGPDAAVLGRQHCMLTSHLAWEYECSYSSWSYGDCTADDSCSTAFHPIRCVTRLMHKDNSPYSSCLSKKGSVSCLRTELWLGEPMHLPLFDCCLHVRFSGSLLQTSSW